MSSVRFLVVALLLLPLLTTCVVERHPAATRSATSQRSDKTFWVTGYVRDAVNQQPVAGATVHFQGVGPYGLLLGSRVPQTDVKGFFALRLPVGNLVKGGYLETRTLFYEGRTPLPADTSQPVTILLRRNAFRFKPIKPNGCQPLADTAQLPRYVTMPIQGLPGSQYAFLIRDTTIHQPRKLWVITLTTGLGAFPREPFTLRIYPCNNEPAAPPCANAPSEAFTVFPLAGTATYDIDSYNVMIPAGGFYIAVDYTTSSNHASSLSALPTHTPYGPVLRPPCARADIRTWEYVIGKGWHRATAAENCWPLYESALSVEVEPAPARR